MYVKHFVTYEPGVMPRTVHTYLVEGLVVPVRVDDAQVGGDPVVVAHKIRLKRGQHQLLVNPVIACGYAVRHLGSSV